ncbi:unnamed protein product [Cuscuta epithymum]|uniref:Uncharacterized protein n=1 Tax=Cuscuta epithymum TaxID=186058 RepID=A0AAV0E4T8_9ASTE|nr:unnamed protein product [Cuscuta epithymum]
MLFNWTYPYIIIMFGFVNFLTCLTLASFHFKFSTYPYYRFTFSLPRDRAGFGSGLGLGLDSGRVARTGTGPAWSLFGAARPGLWAVRVNLARWLLVPGSGLHFGVPARPVRARSRPDGLGILGHLGWFGVEGESGGLIRKTKKKKNIEPNWA